MKYKDRFDKITEWFSKNMETAETELHYDSPFHLLIAVILSAQCTDKRVNMYTPAVFARFPEPEDLAAASFEEVYSLIKSISFPNNKAKHLIGMASALVSQFSGKVPSEVEQIEKLPGAGRKTANVIASIIYNKPVIAVDTHVFRLAHRIGLSDGTTVEKVEKDLTEGFAPELRGKAHHWLILHGRYVCTARKPKCQDCGIREHCREYHLRYFPSGTDVSETTGFTDPFRYIPDRLVRTAGHLVIEELKKWAAMPEGSEEKAFESSLAQGKMLGVLAVKLPYNDETAFLAAFSGTLKTPDGKVTASVKGFVPPIIDLTCPDGRFKKEEAEISEISRQIDGLEASLKASGLEERLAELRRRYKEEADSEEERYRLSKARRDEIRERSKSGDCSYFQEALIRESQFEKAELKRFRARWQAIIDEVETALRIRRDEIDSLAKKRAGMSDSLQKWIFRNAAVHNATGGCSSIEKIFAENGAVPPGGTGECAAPKLLEYAYRNNLKPVAIGEFWYGASPETAVRTQGHFYPSCTSKCGPLLGYMMQGLEISEVGNKPSHKPSVIYEDDFIIVADKPSGMPSVKGLDKRQPLEEWLSKHCRCDVFSVHRLDMDTSGVMVFAKSAKAATALQKQFEEHSVRKTYAARLTAPESGQAQLRPGDKGRIELPLSADYDERPRQKVDFTQGKPSLTEYEVSTVHPDGTADIILHPHTGRTHQIRVHCAHTLGIGCPIAGDLLYGGYTTRRYVGKPDAHRLYLHALSITFRHPVSDKELTFSSATSFPEA